MFIISQVFLNIFSNSFFCFSENSSTKSSNSSQKASPTISHNERKRSSETISPAASQSNASTVSPPIAKQMKFLSPILNPLQIPISKPQDIGMCAPNVTVTSQNSMFEQASMRSYPTNHLNQNPLLMQRPLAGAHNMQTSPISVSEISNLLTSANAAGRQHAMESSQVPAQLQNFMPRGMLTPTHPTQVAMSSPNHPSFSAQTSPGAMNAILDQHHALVMRTAMLQQLYQRVASGPNADSAQANMPVHPSLIQHNPNAAILAASHSLAGNIFNNPYLLNAVPGNSPIAPPNKLAATVSEFSPTGKSPTSLLEQDFLFKNMALCAKQGNDSEFRGKVKEFRS